MTPDDTIAKQLEGAAARLLTVEAEVLAMAPEQRDWFMGKPGHADSFLLAHHLPDLLKELRAGQAESTQTSGDCAAGQDDSRTGLLAQVASLKQQLSEAHRLTEDTLKYGVQLEEKLSEKDAVIASCEQKLRNIENMSGVAPITEEDYHSSPEMPYYARGYQDGIEWARLAARAALAALPDRKEE